MYTKFGFLVALNMFQASLQFTFTECKLHFNRTAKILLWCESLTLTETRTTTTTCVLHRTREARATKKSVPAAVQDAGQDNPLLPCNRLPQPLPMQKRLGQLRIMSRRPRRGWSCSLCQSILHQKHSYEDQLCQSVESLVKCPQDRDDLTSRTSPTLAACGTISRRATTSGKGIVFAVLAENFSLVGFWAPQNASDSWTHHTPVGMSILSSSAAPVDQTLAAGCTPQPLRSDLLWSSPHALHLPTVRTNVARIAVIWNDMQHSMRERTTPMCGSRSLHLGGGACPVEPAAFTRSCLVLLPQPESWNPTSVLVHKTIHSRKARDDPTGHRT